MFRIEALAYETFADLFALPDAELAGRRARRVTADGFPGYPCRVSLQDAQPGETLMLVHYVHQAADTPYAASHAIFVREGADRVRPEPGTVPDMLLRRPISLRAFDGDGMMIVADLAEGERVGPTIDRMLSDPQAAEVHLHNAKPGCFAARAVRA